MSCQHNWVLVPKHKLRESKYLCTECDADMSVAQYESIKQAYNAGVAAERERCAAICEADIQEHAITITAAQQETHNKCCQYLAAAIRRGE